MLAQKISATIITFNEELNLERCLKSLQGVVDEIVICDGNSTDNTAAIAAKYHAKFFTVPFKGHIQQKNSALDLASNNIVLSLDADEELSHELRKAIAAIKQQWDADAYYMRRLNNFCGQWIKHGDWYPDKKIRLWDKRKGRWGGTNPHDKVILQKDAVIKHIPADLLHYSYKTLQEFVVKSERYAFISANAHHKNGRKINLLQLIFTAPVTFFADYLLKGGFKDGFSGFYIAVISAYANFIKYSYLYKLNKTSSL